MAGLGAVSVAGAADMKLVDGALIWFDGSQIIIIPRDFVKEDGSTTQMQFKLHPIEDED